MMSRFALSPIGVIRTPFAHPKGTPIQPHAGKGVGGSVEVFPEYSAGLKDLGGFSHIILIYRFHRIRRTKLSVIPFLDSQVRGVFATRAPARPNHLGMSVVRLLSVRESLLEVQDLDIVDGTPLLDIKPFFPIEYEESSIRLGWLENRIGKMESTVDDERFLGS